MKAIDGIISSEKGILTRGRRFDLLLTSDSLFVIDGSLTGLRFDSSNEEHFSQKPRQGCREIFSFAGGIASFAHIHF